MIEDFLPASSEHLDQRRRFWHYSHSASTIAMIFSDGFLEPENNHTGNVVSKPCLM